VIEGVVVLDGSAKTEDVQGKISRYPDLTWCVIRDEAGETIAWYALDAGELLLELESVTADTPLREAIDRDRNRAEVGTIFNARYLQPRTRHTVVTDGSDVAGIVPGQAHGVIPGLYRDWLPQLQRFEPRRVERFLAWPKIDVPATVFPHDEFTLTIGLSSREPHGLVAPVVVDPLKDETEFDLDVYVAAMELDAPEGWHRTLHVDPAHELPSTSLPLRVRAGARNERVLIHVTFIYRGIVCGHATSAIAIGQTLAVMPAALSACSIPPASEEAADLVVMIRKSDGNSATGNYVWSMSSARAPVDPAPFEIRLPDEPRTYARTLMADIDDLDGKALVDDVLRGIGYEIAAFIPAAFWAALHAVADSVASEQRPPLMLLYSEEEFMPWEMAMMEEPLDDGPPYLGTQVILGRWIYSQRGAIANHPDSTIVVNDLAVLAPNEASTDLRASVREARRMVRAYGAIAIDATDDDVHQLLAAEIDRRDGSTAEIGVVHFACHGNGDPTEPEHTGLRLISGRRISPRVFGASILARKFGPLMFLNACEVGMPQRLLPEQAGFAATCLRGGFRAFIAPLWSVDDDSAADVAHRFYEATLERGALVADVLREIRRSSTARDATALSYVYYGHPRLRLQFSNEARQ